VGSRWTQQQADANNSLLHRGIEVDCYFCAELASDVLAINDSVNRDLSFGAGGGPGLL
jgi:hypothetical protein